MRIILDTNVVLSALIKVDSKPYKVVQAWLDGRFELVSSAAQLEEIARVSRYSQVRRFIEPAEVGWLVNRIRDRALLVERLPDVDASADPGDNFLLAMAGRRRGVSRHGRQSRLARNRETRKNACCDRQQYARNAQDQVSTLTCCG